MTGRLLRITWFHFYDELGRNFLVNILWWCALLFPLPILGLPIALCALCYYAERLARFQDPPLKVFIEGYRLYMWRGLLLGWGYILLGVPLILCFLFYLGHLSEFGWIALIPAGISWSLLVWYGLAGLYYFPLVVMQHHGLWGTLKRAALAVAIQPWMTVIAVATGILWSVVSLIIPPLITIVPAVWWCITGCAATLLLLNEYDDSVPSTPLSADNESIAQSSLLSPDQFKQCP